MHKRANVYSLLPNKIIGFYFVSPNKNHIFVGVRQAGKSYLLYQRVQQLLAEGKLLEDIVYVNFDDERLQGMAATDFDLILQAYHSMYSGQPIFFFDEIQNVD